MCTASWLFHNDGYSLFFNRDETLTRSKAEPPEIVQIENGEALMPIDPDGGGTWLGVNSSGWTYALLNYYQGTAPSGPLTSRGNIVKRALHCATISQLEQALQTLLQGRFAPFSLLCVAPQGLAKKHKPPEQTEHNQSILLLQWTGQYLQRQIVNSLMTSSSKHFEQTQRARQLAATHSHIPAAGCSSGKPDEHLQRHRDFHRSHNPERGTHSVCMHRKNAKTVSLSEVSVLRDVATFSYADGSPCEANTPLCTELALRLQ